MSTKFQEQAQRKALKSFLSANGGLSGGAISNMYSVMVARYKFFPEVKTKGMAAAPRLVLFTSEHVCVTLSSRITSWEHLHGAWKSIYASLDVPHT